MNKKAIIALMGMTAAGLAGAANITVTNDIVTSTTWTSNNVYNIAKQVYVRSGATLTIDAGTVCKSSQGSLAVSRGAKIYVNGTQNNPVIMTSTNDNMTSWHEGCNEWGNLTIMGKGLISASHYAGVQVGSNTKTPTGLNVKQMEGLIAETPAVNDQMYGGNDDNDDSGSIHYLSLRYGGLVVGMNNELNGLSLGGLGRATDIDHVEIMNNVDDGIEVWGGTVNLKYISVWNIGDDNLDCDEGWRGKAQFGLLVQGYSVDAAQGSGVGDNMFEIDGAEDSDAQPVTTARIANFTVIGQPVSGDAATAWRDNARVQYNNCLFMDIGEEIVRLDWTDGDGGSGYGYNGTLNWTNTWATSYTNTSPVNAGTWTAGAFNDPAVMYTAQTSGNLAELRSCLLYACAKDANDMAFGNGLISYKDSAKVSRTDYAIGAFNGTYSAPANNATLDNIITNVMPIVSYSRGVVKQLQTNTMSMANITNINPCAANDALTSATTLPNDGFFTPVSYRGAFSANNNWLKGWTAVDAYGMTSGSAAVDPTSTIQMTASTFFPTTAGKLYTVEQSSDMKTWTPVATVTGDGSIKSATDLAAFDSAKFYRAIIQ